jgi:transposase
MFSLNNQTHNNTSNILSPNPLSIVMYPTLNSANNLTSVCKHLEEQSHSTESESLDCLEVKDSLPETMLKPSLVSNNKKKRRTESESAMLESRRNIKKKTSTGKSSSYKINTHNTQSCQTSDQGLTGTEKTFKHFWTTFTKEESKRWWLPTKTDCADSDLSSWNGSAKSLIAKSWFVTKVTQKIQETKTTQDLPSHPTLTKNLQMTSLQSSPSLQPETMASDLQKIEKEESKWKVQKIRLFPTKKQKQVLNTWFGAARWTYNQCVRAFLQRKFPCYTATVLRKYCLNSDSILFQKNRWLEKTPFDIRDEAMRDFVKAVEINFKKMKKGDMKFFTMKFRKKKEGESSIIILKKHWKNGILFPTFFGKDPIASSEVIPERLYADSRMIKTRDNKYFLCLVLPIEIKSEEEKPKERILSIDPGVRTFLTGYDPSGYVYEIGKGDMSCIKSLFQQLDHLEERCWNGHIEENKTYKPKSKQESSSEEENNSKEVSLKNQRLSKKKSNNVSIKNNNNNNIHKKPKKTKEEKKEHRKKRRLRQKKRKKRQDDKRKSLSVLKKKHVKMVTSSKQVSTKTMKNKNWERVKHKKRYRIRKLYRRIHEKIKNLMSDIHRKSAKWMLENFTNIVIGHFKPSEMVQRRKRKIISTTSRELLTWSHYRFREYLISKSREYPWCKVNVIGEHYTSQTCGNCGSLNKKIGGNKNFICPSCKTEIDRDMNASRNIWLKYMNENQCN